MTRAMTVLTLIALLAGSASAVFDAHFWGSPIATLTRDADSIGVPMQDLVGYDAASGYGNIWTGPYNAENPRPVGHDEYRTYYARIPLSIIQGWVSNPETNFGLAMIPRETSPGTYPNNDMFFTYLATYRWAYRPRLRMAGWVSYAQEQGGIRYDDQNHMWSPIFTEMYPSRPDGSQYGGMNIANVPNVFLYKWTDLVTGPGGSDLGDHRTFSVGLNWGPDPGTVYDIYVAPAYWDEWDITYAGYVTPGGTTYLPGDANQDGVVNTDDLGVLLANWGQSGVWTSGDFNADGVVNTDDLGLLLGNWGQSSVVPEPATLALLGLGGLGLIRRRR